MLARKDNCGSCGLMNPVSRGFSRTAGRLVQHGRRQRLHTATGLCKNATEDEEMRMDDLEIMDDTVTTNKLKGLLPKSTKERGDKFTRIRDVVPSSGGEHFSDFELLTYTNIFGSPKWRRAKSKRQAQAAKDSLYMRLSDELQPTGGWPESMPYPKRSIHGVELAQMAKYMRNRPLVVIYDLERNETDPEVLDLLGRQFRQGLQNAHTRATVFVKALSEIRAGLWTLENDTVYVYKYFIEEAHRTYTSFTKDLDSNNTYFVCAFKQEGLNAKALESVFKFTDGQLKPVAAILDMDLLTGSPDRMDDVVSNLVTPWKRRHSNGPDQQAEEKLGRELADTLRLLARHNLVHTIAGPGGKISLIQAQPTT